MFCLNPEYARPDNGRTYTNSKGQTFDNRSVVPYNPFLSARYDCHINVEICASVKAIKYIHKYIYDCATVGVREDIDEIQEHIGSCYIGPTEGFWHIAEFTMHEEKPSVHCLHVHLQDKQTVNSDDDDDLEEIMDHDDSDTTSTTNIVYTEVLAGMINP